MWRGTGFFNLQGMPRLCASPYRVSAKLCQRSSGCQRSQRRICPGLQEFRYRNFLIPRQWFRSSSSFTEEPDIIDESLLNMDKSLSNYFMPPNGHKIFVIQPRLRLTRKRNFLDSVEHRLDEACALVKTLPHWTVSVSEIHTLKHIDQKTVFGKGKMEELTEKIRRSHSTAVFLSLDIITGLQLHELWLRWKRPVYDRYSLVLQILRHGANTKAAKLQVSLGEIPFLKSRDIQTRKSAYAELNTVNMPFKIVGASGETHLELRRRLYREREHQLHQELDKVRMHRARTRALRKKQHVPVVSVIGYTNSGKTSLIKAITGDENLVPRNVLFATTDVTGHATFLLPNNQLRTVFIDTVGFISDIPTDLVDAFRATLEDIIDSNLLVHVRDIHSPSRDAQKQEVLKTLAFLGVPETLVENMIEVNNKIDLIDNDAEFVLDNTDATSAVTISCVTGHGLEKMKQLIRAELLRSMGLMQKRFKIASGGAEFDWLYKNTAVVDVTADKTNPQNVLLTAVVSGPNLAKFLAKFS